MRWIGCLTSQLTISQWYMWRHIHVDMQADWRRSRTYGRAPKVIDISQGSLMCPSKHRHGTNLFIRRFRHPAPISRLLRHAGDTEDTFVKEPSEMSGVGSLTVVQLLQSVYTYMYRHIYNWNIVECDIKQPILLTSSWYIISYQFCSSVYNKVLATSGSCTI